MDNFLDASINGAPFREFSTSHIITLVILVILMIWLTLWFTKSKTEKSVDSFRYFLAAFLLINEFLSVFWCISAGVFSLDYSLPLHLCDAAALLSVIMLVRGYQTSFELVYFWGLGGSVQALITPDLHYPFPHFVFFNFFITHSSVIIAIIYMITAKGYRPSIKSIPKAFLYTNLYAGFVAVVNAVTGGDYMFLCAKPRNPSIIDFLGPWPWYILSLEGVFLVVYLILCLPFTLSARKREHSDQ